MTSLLFSIVAIVCGTLAASAVVIKKMPDSADIIKKIKPYEGFIGMGALAMGFFQLVKIGSMLSSLTGMVALAASVACIVMGFLLGFPVLQDLVIDELSEGSREKADQVYEKLTPYKVTAGLVAIGTGIYTLIF